MNEIKKHTDAIARFNSAELDLGTCRKLEIINQEADRLEKEIISLKTEIKRKDELLMYIFFEGPDDVKRFGPVEIESLRFGGFFFTVFGRDVFPGRFSPLWVIARMLYPEQFKRRKANK